jgi:UDP-glucose 4-epimerase
MITGACGFLGRNLVRHLQSNHELVLLDLIDAWETSSIIHHVDVARELATVDALMEGVDIVLHLANRARIDPSWNDYADYYETNITGSQNVLAAAQRAGVKKFIYISSSSVYGNNGCTPQKETDPLCPTNPYAVSKMAAEWALRAQAQKGDTELIIVRPFTMYGNFMTRGPYSLVISKFIVAWLTEKPLELHGGGLQTRDFLHASDAVKAMELIIDHGKNGEVFNLGSGVSVSIKDLADIVSDRQTITEHRVGAVDCTCADITSLRALGFEPKVDVKQWLTDAVKDLKLKNYHYKETLCL